MVLPDEREASTIGAVATVLRGVTYKRDQALTSPSPGYAPLVRATNIMEGRLELDDGLVYVPSTLVKAEQFLRAGDIVLATSSGSLTAVGRSASVTQDWEGGFGAFCGVLRPGPEVIPSYLAYFVSTRPVRERWAGLAAGTNINNLKRKDLEQTPIPLPPLEDQERIVAAIEEQFSRLDAAEVSIRRSRKQLGVFKASALADSFAGDHPVKRLGELADTQLGKMLSQKANKGTGLPYLRNKNVHWARFDLDDVAKMEFSAAEAERFLLRPGDVLICEGGEVGRAAVWKGELDVCYYQKALHRVRPRGELLPEFLMYYLRRLADTNGFARYVTGSTIDHLPQEDLRVIPVPAPSTQVQASIVDLIEQLMSLAAAMESQLDTALVRSEALRRAVLRDAFSGRLEAHGSAVVHVGATV
jgi:type I restriction enzyme S subunit